MSTLTGYLHSSYAESLAEFGEPRRLLLSQSSVLLRAIPGSDRRDAMGPYPLFCAADWTQIESDFVDLGREVVSFTAVTDPFADIDEPRLRAIFPDLVIPYKPHFVANLAMDPLSLLNSHHRYYVKWSRQRVSVEVVEVAIDLLNDWWHLYRHLIERHQITGIRAFSKESFARQLDLPGLVAFRAIVEGRTVAAHLWLRMGNVAYSHLACSNEVGYKMSAAYSLYAKALEYFQGRVQFLDLGAGAGNGEKESGLEKFKKGWANESRLVYLVGRVFDRAEYDRLTKRRGSPNTHYFPAYRFGEFS